jgi:hypothetical protein
MGLVLTCPDGFKRFVPFRNPSRMARRKPLSLQCPKAGFSLFRNHQFSVQHAACRQFLGPSPRDDECE